MTAPDRPFDCERCGLCCRSLQGHEMYRHLDRGDGVCRHLVEHTNLCGVYENRPDECRVDLAYERLFAGAMSRATYQAATLAICRQLQAAAGLRAAKKGA